MYPTVQLDYGSKAPREVKFLGLMISVSNNSNLRCITLQVTYYLFKGERPQSATQLSSSQEDGTLLIYQIAEVTIVKYNTTIIVSYMNENRKHLA